MLGCENFSISLGMWPSVLEGMGISPYVLERPFLGAHFRLFVAIV
jgi:hypothetical protein